MKEFGGIWGGMKGVGGEFVGFGGGVMKLGGIWGGKEGGGGTAGVWGGMKAFGGTGGDFEAV